MDSKNTRTYKIEVDCANCANNIESALRKLPDIEDVRVNFLTQKVKITFKENANIEKVMKIVAKACKKVDNDCNIYF